MAETEPVAANDAICEAFLDHLGAGFDLGTTCTGPAQLAIHFPDGARVFDVTIREGLCFQPAERARPQVAQVVFSHDLVKRLLKANEFLSPRDYDVRRASWVDDHDALSWAIFQAALRPNSWAYETLSRDERTVGSTLRDIETLHNPSLSDLVQRIASRLPCKLRFDQMHRMHSPQALAAAAEAQFRLCADKEVKDRSKHLPDFVATSPRPQASYRMEQTAALWSKFGVPFYGWTSFACLEVVAWGGPAPRWDLFPVQSALTEFRLCASGQIEIALVSGEAEGSLSPFQSFGGMRYCRTPVQASSATVVLEAGELLMITPGWYSQTIATSPGALSVSHYWRYG